MPPLYPSLYQVNTRVYLGELGRALGRPATLDDWPDAELDRLAARGFDWLWPLGVWQTGAAGRICARTALDWTPVRAVLPDLSDADIVSSPFAITAYAANADFGGDGALGRLRERLRKRGVRLLLDFVPNHTAPDHPWVASHPEYYVHGTEDDLRREPQNYCRRGGAILAYGRDPYFPGWTDTLQLNYRHPGLRAAMTRELCSVAERCDAVRCDMAMLVLPDVIARTWGRRPLPDGAAPVDDPFWPEATATVRARRPDFVFMAEAYWDLEWTLQQQGFDYTYDKRLYDRLHERSAGATRGHLCADSGYQLRSVRFLENHDEPRAAAAFDPEVYRAAAAGS
jgi:glycosidase